ncbi:MAG: TerB family tellurite resistance protein [Pseudomonadota bacterium]
MYSTYKTLIEQLDSGDQQEITYEKRDLRKALGVLLYRVILVDGRVRHEEVDLFRTIVETSLGITEDELNNFEDAVQALATSEENFGELVKELRVLPQNEKSAIINFMQDISISDKELHELELNLVARVTKLLQE